MSLGIAAFIGLAPQALFIGGNFTISSVFIPLLLKDYVPNEIKIKQFSELYDGGMLLFASCSTLSMISYAIEAYVNRNNENVFPVALTGAIISISPLPLTVLVIAPVVKALKNFRLTQTGKDNGREINTLLKKWNLLSIGRLLLFSAGFVNTLYFIAKNTIEKPT